MNSTVNVCWRRIVNSTGTPPKARHGHRAVAIKELIVIFGGGNCGIMSGVYVFNTDTNVWFRPAVRGDVPDGRASFGMVVDGTRIIIFGGMLEYKRSSRELYELEASRWEWKKLDPHPPPSRHPLPLPRLGHSFTLVQNKIYLFGGLALDDGNGGENGSMEFPRFLNDLYTLELQPNDSVAWDVPETFGVVPPERESHSTVAHKGTDGNYRLIIFGGMSGYRRNDLWTLDLGSMTWNEISLCGPVPLARSLHTATVVGSKMYVFAGWVPVESEEKVIGMDKAWKVSNDLLCLNLLSMKWEFVCVNLPIEMPKARAGHCAVLIHGRIYIWSGRDGFRKAWNNQVCCNDLWYLEICHPAPTTRPQLVKSGLNALEINWAPVYSAECYLLQTHKLEVSTQIRTLDSQLNKQLVIAPFKDLSQPNDKELEIKQNTSAPSSNSVVPVSFVNSSPSEQHPLALTTPGRSTIPNLKTKFIVNKSLPPGFHQRPLHPQRMPLAMPKKNFSTLQVYSSKTRQSIPLRGQVYKLNDTMTRQQAIKTLNLLPSNLVTIKPENVKNNKIVYNKPGFKLVAVNNNNQMTLAPDNRAERPATSDMAECEKPEQETAPSSVAKIIQNTNLQVIQNVLVPLKEARSMNNETIKSNQQTVVANENTKIVYFHKDVRSVNSNINQSIVVQAQHLTSKESNAQRLLPDKVDKSRLQCLLPNSDLSKATTMPITSQSFTGNQSQPQSSKQTEQNPQGSSLDKLNKSRPQLPSVVTCIKIKRCQITGGVYLSWELSDPSVEVTEYTVSLQVETKKRKITYMGAKPWAFISKIDIDAAIASTELLNPLVIIFITAKNEHGSGPTVAIRWLTQASH